MYPLAEQTDQLFLSESEPLFLGRSGLSPVTVPTALPLLQLHENWGLISSSSRFIPDARD